MARAVWTERAEVEDVRGFSTSLLAQLYRVIDALPGRRLTRPTDGVYPVPKQYLWFRVLIVEPQPQIDWSADQELPPDGPDEWKVYELTYKVLDRDERKALKHHGRPEILVYRILPSLRPFEPSQ